MGESREFVLRTSDPRIIKWCTDIEKAEEIVRCKDCKYGLKCVPSPFVELNECQAISSPCFMKHTDFNWYCAYGKRKDGELE